jgi:molecular chaperone GrpE (heat shock protein)
MTAEEDAALIAAQLAELTEHVDAMAQDLETIRTRANDAQERADTQQERIDLAARELAQVSDRLQAAANALRESI